MSHFGIVDGNYFYRVMLMNYGFAEFVNVVAIILGAMLIVFGGVAFVGLLQEGMLLAASSGGIPIVVGIGIIAVAQLSNAMIDTAKESRKTNELLNRMLSDSKANVSGSAEYRRTSEKTVPPISSDKISNEPVTTYKTYPIYKRGGGFIVLGEWFASMNEAKKFIDQG